MFEHWIKWPWLTIQIIGANVAVILALATHWYLAFMRQSDVYSERLMSTFNIEPGQLHAMYVADVERQLWTSVTIGLCVGIFASVGLAFLIVRPLRALAQTTERLRHGDYRVRSQKECGEIGRLAENVNALAAALEQEERRRTQYLADLGHELRTPITSLRGYTEGLEDGIFTPDKDFYDLMNGELSQLTALTHTIDAMQFFGPGRRCEPTGDELGVGAFLHDTQTRWSARFQERGLRLNLQLPKDLTDRQIALPAICLKQIADNLLSNMIRYAAEDTCCEIVVARGTVANAISFMFRNTAPDITPENVPFLFDRFFRVSESRTRVQREHPTGLGLSIVKQLCLSYKGNVSANLDGHQLVIRIDLPLSKLQRNSFQRKTSFLDVTMSSGK